MCFSGIPATSLLSKKETIILSLVNLVIPVPC